MKTKAKTVACYVRVSTVGQNEKGQRVEIERYVRRHAEEITPSPNWADNLGPSSSALAVH